MYIYIYICLTCNLILSPFKCRFCRTASMLASVEGIGHVEWKYAQADSVEDALISSIAEFQDTCQICF